MGAAGVGVIIPPECLPQIELQRPGIIDYDADIANDWRMIEPYLPARAESILDIGCGVAGIDVYLRRRFPAARLELLDSDGAQGFYGYGAAMGYGSRRCAEMMLAANGAGKVDRWHDVGTREVLRADLVVSTYSWGFHYPLATYDVRGFCIADIRRELGEGARGTVIWTAKSLHRCAWHN